MTKKNVNFKIKLVGVSPNFIGCFKPEKLSMFALITLPVNFIATTTAYVGAIFTDVGPLVFLAMGLPLAFWVIRSVINLARVR